MEGICLRNFRDENLRVETMVHPRRRIPTQQGIQSQSIEEIFIEGIFDLGVVKLRKEQKPGKDRPSDQG